MRTIEKYSIDGTLGKYPPRRGVTKTGKEYVSFTLGVNEGKDKWRNVNVMAMGDYNVKCAQDVGPGSHVYVEGGIKLDIYEGEPKMTVFASKITHRDRKTKSRDTYTNKTINEATNSFQDDEMPF